MAQQEILLQSGTNELEIIEFYIDEADPATGQTRRSHFGVNVAKVWEVIESPDFSGFKSAVNDCFLGAIPLRDIILPVIDLAVWLKMPKVKSPFEVILVTEFNKTVTGFLVSGVTMIHRVSWKQVEPPSHYLSNIRSNCITGMVQLDDHFVLLLDLEKTISELDPDYTGFDQEMTAAQTTYRALIVDDSTTLRYIIKQKLEVANFEVQSLNDGEEAWNALLALKERARQEGRRVTELLDILISDIEMPQMDGYTLTKNVKSDPALKCLPVILFSSLITDDQRHKGMSVKADDQISKPEFATLARRAIGLIEQSNAS